KVRVGGGQVRRQQGRHVLHRTGLAGIDRSLGNEFGRNLRGGGQHVGKLRLGAGIEAVGQRAGGGKLGQLRFGGQGIGHGARMVHHVGARQKPRGSAGKEALESHGCNSSFREWGQPAHSGRPAFPFHPPECSTAPTRSELQGPCQTAQSVKYFL